MRKSFSEQMEEQLEPRPEAKETVVSPEPKAWDHTGKHEEFHEHTQD